MRAFLTAILTFLLFAAPLAAQADIQLKKNDHKKLGKPFSVWLTGKLEADFEATTGALEDLSGAIVDLEKKTRGVPVLSMVADWGFVLDAYRTFSTKGLKKGKTTLQEIPGDRGAYAQFLPKKYKGKQSWPLLVILPGDHLEPEAAIQQLPTEMLEQCIVVAPDMRDLKPGEALSESKGRLRLLLPLSIVSGSLMVDRSRVMLLGLGSGAADASTLAAAQPGVFSAYAWAGGAIASDLAEGNLALISGKEHPDAPSALTWLLGHAPRNAYPLEMDIQFTNDWSKRFFYVWAKPDTGVEGRTPRMKVVVDRESNTIRIDAEAVEKADIFLNDVPPDLDKPVQVVRNGENYVFNARRSTGTILEYFLNTLDSSSIYTAKIRGLSIPAVAK